MFKVGDKVQLGVLTGDALLNATVDGFYKEFVVIKFDSEGFYINHKGNVGPTNRQDWFISKMIVHPNNLRPRE